MKASWSAPAKVILSGEHAVVYGKPALVCAVDLRLTCTVNRSQQDTQDERIKAMIQTIKEYLHSHHHHIVSEPISVKISSAIPVGRGLGSSAALSVAAVASLLSWYAPKEEFSKDQINSLAYKLEKIFHKNPSGVDNSASCYGGLIYYRKEFEFLKCISALTFKIPRNIEETLYLIDTGKPKESTADMVNQVGTFYNEHTKHAESLMNSIEKTTKRLTVSLIKEDLTFFRTCLSENQQLIEELGVVSDSAKQTLKNLREYGTGKITGAGGKKKGAGFILFSAHDPTQLESALTEKKLKFMKLRQDYAGLKTLTYL